MIVFLHGVPENAALWDRVRGSLEEESVALELPGFGCPRPEGFGATMDDYANWLVERLAAFEEPVDLVGHDWGAGFTYRVATTRADLVRSWVADVANVLHEDYVWHDFAKIWQTPLEGERYFEHEAATPVEELAAAYQLLDLAPEDATTMASWSNEVMGSCILDLYRSATPNPFAHWGAAWAPSNAPGLVLFPDRDPFGDEAQSRAVAATLGAGHATLEGAGHFWPLQAPERGVDALRAFYATRP